MELTERELRERGIRRSREEVAEEAGRFAYVILAAMPTGRWVPEPVGELSAGEAEALREGGLDLSPPSPDDPDPLAATAAKYAALLASSLTTAEAAGLLGVSEGRVRQRLKEGTLYGVKAGRENRLPAFQFAGAGEVPGMNRVVRALRPGAHPVGVLNFFASPSPDLYPDEREERPLSPRDWLLSGGDPGALVALAEEL
ncbi:MAG: helix-turn-helix domain-containing protein [Actinomycetota bacterium]|nr:helix-turn-helix domain-containing protein [Actinomycetota bacterium]